MSEQELRILIDDDDVSSPAQLRPGGAGKRPGRDGRSLDEINAASARSEAAAAAAHQETQRLQAVAAELQVGQVLTAISTIRSAADAAQHEYQNAMDMGDYGAASEAQRRMANSEARIVDLEKTANVLQARAAAPPQISDPVEAYCQGRTAPTQAWLRAHPEWVTDRAKNTKLTAAHYDALGEGCHTDTPEYFAHVEKFIGLRGGGGTNGARRVGNGGVDMSQVNRHDPNTHVIDGNSVYLTAGELKTAEDGTLTWSHDDPHGRFKRGDPIGREEFARRKKAMIAEGRYRQLESY